VTKDTKGMGEISGPTAGGAGRTARRGLLAGAAAVVGVIAAETLASTTPAQAAQGSAVLLGQDNTGATARTGLFDTGSESAVLADPVTHIGVAGTGGANGSGVQGIGAGSGSGVFGSGGASAGAGVTGFGAGGGPGVSGTGDGFGPGVVGNGGTGTTGAHGVEGFGSGTGSGLVGTSGANSGAGVVGSGRGNAAGVLGIGAGSGAGVTGSGGAGGGAGVAGSGGSGGGDGVVGTVTSAGNGVHGRATAAKGVGVLAENDAGGPALKVTGRTVFSRSGVVTVAAGSSKVTKTGVALTAASLVLATLQQDVPGVWVRSAVPNSAGSSFTVHLNKAAPASTKIAWFVVN
jgi:hypothetical protein